MNEIHSPADETETAVLPATGFLRQPQVLRFVPISKSTLWRRVQARTFPQPVKLSERVTAWRAEDLRDWIDQQVPAGAPAVHLPAAPAAHAAQPPPPQTPHCPRRGTRR
jgi:prophage regulatory protein